MGSPESHAIFPGTFDPVTFGHLNALARMQRIFPHVTVAVLARTPKPTLFDIDQRIALIQQAVAGLIPVVSFDGLLIEKCRQLGAWTIVRGVRTGADFEYERRISLANRAMAPDIETMLIVSAAEHSHISSSLVREIASLRGDVSAFVPSCVRAALEERFGAGQGAAPSGSQVTPNPVPGLAPDPALAQQQELPPSLRPKAPAAPVRAAPLPPLPPPTPQ